MVIMDTMTIELIVRFVIELFWIYACVYAARSTKLVYWRQCWYIVLLGCLIHAAYILIALTGILYAPYAGMIRNLGMGIVAVGILMLARRTREIMGR